MKGPLSLSRSVENVERDIGREIEALVVPLLDFERLQKGRAPINPKIKPQIYVSQKRPLITRGIADCNAIVLFKGSRFALLHEYSQIDPNEYLNQRLERLKSKRNLEGIQAIQVGGDEKTFRKIGEILNAYGIPVLSSYCDEFNRDVDFSKWIGKMGPKDIHIFPDQRKVIMFRRFYRLVYGEMVDLSERKVLYEE